MANATYLDRPSAVRVQEMREACRIDVPSGALDTAEVVDTRLACLQALERGASQIFVDLTGVGVVCREAIDLLEAVGEELLAKHGTLWLANREVDSAWRPVLAEGIAGLAGMSTALDGALAADRESTPEYEHDERGER